MKSGTKMFTVDKFLGINEAADGFTELKMGEASEMVNFTITEGLNLALRPGVQRVDLTAQREPSPILASWAGYISEDSKEERLVIVDFYEGQDRIWLYTRNEMAGTTVQYRQDGALGLTSTEDNFVKIFAFGGRLWIMSRANTVTYQGGQFVEEKPYIPLVIAGAAPEGGGTTIENINLLTALRRIDYSADGEAVAYVLPTEALNVEAIIIDNVSQDVATVGAWSGATHTFTFNAAPVKGVGNVEFTYSTDAAATEATRLQILSQPLVEAYNGSTDTRLFVGGNGNVCYYTGVTQHGQITAMYFPALYEVAVDMTGASVTGLVRHYGKLLVFTKDGTYTVSYEPVTLADGTTTAGFYLRSANRGFGSDVVGQIQTVDNFPRTITKDGIYEWKITSSYYQDERYARRVSDMVQKSLRNADIHKIVTCDNSFDKTYYVFLNDDQGTVLVNRYGLGKENMWCIYRSELFKGVTSAFLFGAQVFFANGEETFCLNPLLTMDAALEPGGEPMDILARWESGYMDFGADFRRKYTSQIYVSMLPHANSEMVITAETDRRSEYTEKTVVSNVFSFANVDFRKWTFDTDTTPRIKRVRLKVKKFVYYKLVFRVEGNGASATVLGFDQEIRYGSMAK